jgi:hypothetical protein
MLDSFIRWFDDYLRQHEPPAIIKGIVSLLGFASLAGTVFGSEAIRIGGFIGVSLAIIGSMLLTLAYSRKIRLETGLERSLLQRYCNFIADKPVPAILIKKWEQLVIVQENGDCKEVVTIRAEVLRKELYFIRLLISTTWQQTAKLRHQVAVKVRSLTVEGERGIEWHVTKTWIANDRLHLLAHLDSPAKKGGEINLEMEKVWPGKCQPLMRDKQSDSFTLEFSKLMPVERVEYEVRLPENRDAHLEAVGFAQPHPEMRVERRRKGDNFSFHFIAEKIPTSQEVGMRLQIK